MNALWKLFLEFGTPVPNLSLANWGVDILGKALTADRIWHLSVVVLGNNRLLGFDRYGGLFNEVKSIRRNHQFGLVIVNDVNH